MSESREVRREERREQRALDRETQKMFMKIFGYMMIGMFILAAIMFIVQVFRGDSGGEETPAEQETYIEEPAETPGFSASFDISFGKDAE